MYKITIEKIERVRSKTQKYQKLREQFSDEEEMKLYRKKGEEIYPPQFGYVEVEEDDTLTTKVLEQMTDELDLPAVIKAINKI